jgi:hypothetical protein
VLEDALEEDEVDRLVGNRKALGASLQNPIRAPEKSARRLHERCNGFDCGDVATPPSQDRYCRWARTAADHEDLCEGSCIDEHVEVAKDLLYTSFLASSTIDARGIDVKRFNGKLRMSLAELAPVPIGIAQ